MHAEFDYTTTNGTITITRYNGSGGSVTIPSTIDGLPVTAIGDYSFAYSTNVTSAMIPSSVTSLGDRAFAACSSLTAITVDAANTVYSSAGGVLFNKSLAMLIKCPEGKAGGYTIPNSVTSIGYVAFSGSKLTSVTIPNSVSSIGDLAFSSCRSLTSVTIPDSVTSIGVSAFSQCTSLTSATLPNSLTSIGGFAFHYCTSLSSVTIPSSVTSIGMYAFYYCTSLTSIIIPNSVTDIGMFAFYHCTSLTSVTIPNSVTRIGRSAFDGCASLTNATIGNSVTNIEMDAFGGSKLASITIPSSVTSIGSSAFAFSVRLAGVYFLGNAPIVPPGATLFLGSGIPTVYYLPGTTGWGATFGGGVTALWKPQVQTSDTSFGVQTNQFGFNIGWASGLVIVVEACTNPSNPVWEPVQTNTLTSDSLYFSDLQWTNYPGRFYRLRSP